MALSKYDSTRGTTNLARIARAILGPCVDVLRDVLTKEITPPDLKKELNKYPTKYRISQHQKQVVNNGDFSKFDISLLYMFLRNLGSIPEHKNKWGTDPDPFDKSVSANIERIRNLRNEWGHFTDLSLSDSVFEQHWKHIFQTVKDLEGYLGATTVYQDALNNLKTCCMDPDSIQPYIKKLLWVEQLVTDITDLKEEVQQIKKTIEPASLNVVHLKENLSGDEDLEKELETVSLLTKMGFDYGNTANKLEKESTVHRIIFEQWQQDNNLFISTKACKKVEQLIKSQNIVIVAGHSGSGKSAIIQQIALKYRMEGWIVKPIYEVSELINESLVIPNKTLFVLNDPIGKESVDEIAYDTWRQHEEKIKALFKKIKVLMSCRKYILSDGKIKGLLKDRRYIVDINDDLLKLDDEEKQSIFRKYSHVNSFSKEKLAAILKSDLYFPLLCKLYFNNVRHQNDALRFFKEPVVVLEEEIRNFRTSSKNKYCALVLLVLFHNVLCVNDLLQDDKSKEKYKHALELCGMKIDTAPYTIGDILQSMEGFFVKKIGDNFHFYHDFVMEITTYVFGSDYPKETIEYADVSFLRRRVKLEDCKEENDKFSIVLSDKFIPNLGKKLFMGIFGEHLLDVVLNPCMKNEKVMNIIIEELNLNPEKYKMLLEKKVLQIEKYELYKITKDFYLSKLSFLNLGNEISPLAAMIVFCHTELSLYCLKALKQTKTDIDDISLFSAVCCNGSLDLLNEFSNDHINVFLNKKWSYIHPIHVVSAFHNFEMMCQLLKFDIDVNLQNVDKTDYKDGCTPLIYATANENNKGESSYETRCNETIKLLLNNGANVNQSKQNGGTPLHSACYNGLNSTVRLLLSKGADINACLKNGISPLFTACLKGYDGTVQLLLNNGADINLCFKDGDSPLFIACQKGHTTIVQLLLNVAADLNVCNENGYTPLLIACCNGHDDTVQLLLENGTDINCSLKDNASPLYLASEFGHDSIVKRLLSKGADINRCLNNGTSPLLVACTKGHVTIVQLLLSNGANIGLYSNNEVSPLLAASNKGYNAIVQRLLNVGADPNICGKNGITPLLTACLNGHNDTVQTLLSNGADINLCSHNGASPLYDASITGNNAIVQHLLNLGADPNICNKNRCTSLIMACFDGHDDTVQTLLSNGADINLCSNNGDGPLYAASLSGHNEIVQRLLNLGADPNICNKNGYTPLLMACFYGHNDTVQTLLSNGADINLCLKDGTSPLYLACKKGHTTIVQLLLNANGANIDLYSNNEVSPLLAASDKGYNAIVQRLLNVGADPNVCDKNGITPLLTACLNGHSDTVQILLNNGADSNVCDHDGVSPLYLASRKGDDAIVQLLLNKGVDINLGNNNRATPLYIACYYKNESTVEILVRNEADINFCYEDRSSPFLVACQNKLDRTVQLLLSKGANINLCKINGVSPLFSACQNGSESIVEFLLLNGADLNLCRNDGTSCLHVACKHGHNSIVQLLLNSGAAINSCQEDGVSPLFLACQNGHESVVKLLLYNGANVKLRCTDGVSPICLAYGNGNYNIFQMLLNNEADANLSVSNIHGNDSNHVSGCVLV